MCVEAKGCVGYLPQSLSTLLTKAVSPAEPRACDSATLGSHLVPGIPSLSLLSTGTSGGPPCLPGFLCGF